MPNVITSLMPSLYRSARKVPAEFTAFMGAASRNFDDAGVPKGGSVKVPVVPTATAAAAPAPSMTFAAGTDRTISTVDFTLNQEAQVSWNLTAEDERQLLLGGNSEEVLAQTLDQGFRSLRNQMEAYLGTVAKNNASRAIGTAGTTPFASDSALLVDARKILVDNGYNGNISAIINSSAEANLLKLTEIKNSAAIGDASAIREGRIGRLYGIDIAASAAVAVHTKGTGTVYLVNSTSLAVGSTTIPADTGTGTIIAGDVVAFAGDANKYVVKTALAGGSFVIQEPGLLTAVADNSAITVENTSTDNIAMGSDALMLVARPSLQPVGGGVEQAIITDPVTRFSTLFLRVVGSAMTSWYMRTVYDAFAPNPYQIVKLRG